MRLQMLNTTASLPEAAGTEVTSVALGEILCNLSYLFFNLDFIQYFCTSLTSKRNFGLCGHVLSCTLNLPSSCFRSEEEESLVS